MTPYYDEGGIAIYHADFRDLIDDVVFDAIVTDAPYGVGLEYEDHDDTVEALDEIICDLSPYLLDGRTHAVFPGVGNLHRWPQPRWTLCWLEPAGARTGRWGFSTWQPILAYGPDPHMGGTKGRRPDSIRMQSASASHRIIEGTDGHPCPKPLPVMTWTVERVTDPGTTVLDPFMGSGTTLLAARASGRKATGIEISERYCEIAARRLTQGVFDFGEAS